MQWRKRRKLRKLVQDAFVYANGAVVVRPSMHNPVADGAGPQVT